MLQTCAKIWRLFHWLEGVEEGVEGVEAIEAAQREEEVPWVVGEGEDLGAVGVRGRLVVAVEPGEEIMEAEGAVEAAVKAMQYLLKNRSRCL